ncbi:MAG: histidinol dehydrogenase [Akkermansia sp.]
MHYFQTVPQAGLVRRERPGCGGGGTFLPYDRVGIYIPGGKAPLVSTSIMTGGLPGRRRAGDCGRYALRRDGRVNPALYMH